jgi:zinc protease
VLALALFAAFAPMQAHAEARAAQTQRAERGVPVQEVVSPGGVSAWLVSDATVPVIVVRAYWKGGAATEPATLIGVTGIMADMMTEGSGELDANAWKERIEELNMSLGFSGGWDGVGMSFVTLKENRDQAFAMARLALSSPRFDAAPLARIKRQLAVAIRARETNPAIPIRAAPSSPRSPSSTARA